MELGQDIETVPSVPYAPQPAQLANASEPSYASLYGEVGSPSLDGAGPVAEPSYASLVAQSPTQATRNVYSPPGSLRDISKEIVARDVQAKKLLEELASSGSRVNRSMAAKLQSQDEDEQIAQALRAGLDAADAKFQGEFDPEAGYANPQSPVLDQIKQSLSANWTRFKSGLARDDGGAMKVWQKKYGEENVKRERGALWFRRNANEKFRKVDPDTFELIGDTILDGSGPIVEGTAAAIAETLGLVGTGMLATTAVVGSGGTAAPAVAAAGPATFAAVTAAAGATGALTRKGVMSLFGVEDEVSTISEMAWGSGLNAATLGLGNGFKLAGRTVLNKFGDIVSTLPKERIRQLAVIRNEFDDFTRQILGGEEAQGLKGAGRGLGNAISRVQDQLDEPVKMVYDKAKELASQKGMENVPVDNLLAQLKNTLDDNFVKFDDKGFAYLPSKTKPPKASTEGAEVAIDMFGEAGLKELERGGTEAATSHMADKALTQKAFGSYSGEGALSKLAEDYNTLLASSRVNGGVPLDKLYDNINTFRNEVQLYKNVIKTPAEEVAYTKLQNAAASDRNEAFKRIFEGTGTEEEKMWKTYFENYSNKIDGILAFKSLFNKKESAEQFAKAIVQPENSERLVKLKSVLGDSSKEWNSFRGEWFDGFIQKHIDPNSGILLTADLKTSMKALGKDVVGELLSKEELGAVNKIIAKGNKIAFTDLLNTATKADIQDILPLTMIPQYAPSRFRGLWNLIAGRKDAADYLLDEGFLKAARNAGTKSDRSSFLAARDFFQKMVDGMKPVKRTITNPATGKKATYEIYIPVVRTPIRKTVDEARREAEDTTGGDATYSVIPE